METILDSKIGLIAGNGQLPVIWAKNAKENGIEVISISLSADNKKDLKKYCSKVYDFGPGEIEKISKILISENIKQLGFIGKVHKGLILRRPKFDAKAIELLKQAKRLNDDAVMLLAVSELEKIGITVIDQTIFIKNLMVPTGVLGKHKPTKEQEEDAKYGFWVAKAMGQVDIGQTVVIKDKMVMAVEAIEGTDRCIERGAKIASKGAVIVKTAKPSQDTRFDVPAFGLDTLKTMKKYKASVIAVEAGKTIIVDQQKTIDYANSNNIVVIAL
ncbi:UDP-2,3-diacylglucosamine diphosphatase LpxI [bacterium]|nr:UDP-2,3-diacylglucosamine diphosphatase LpxI [bacterium]